MRVGSARVVGDPLTAPPPLQAHARQTADGVFECVVVDADGNAVVQLDGYRTVAVQVPLADDIAADLHAAYRD